MLALPVRNFTAIISKIPTCNKAFK
jgi:hypothetical protein